MKIKPQILIWMVLLGILFSGDCTRHRVIQAKNSGAPFALGSSSQLQPNQGCSVIYATDGELMLGGNNEEYINPLTKVWFIPGENDDLGRVYFGFDDYFAQGGMNEQGLFFDGLALDEAFPVSKQGKQHYTGNLTDKVMTECATVACAVELFERYYTRDTWQWQLFFGDATGESAIIEAGTVIRQRGSYQVATNFSQSHTPPEDSHCWRYPKAVAMLEETESLSVDAIRDVLNAVNQNTLYSNVYDLKNKIIYLYYFHNYEDVVVLDLAEELEQGYHTYDLPSLFPNNQEAEAWASSRLRTYNALITSRGVTDLDPNVLHTYAGAYEMPEGWGPPEQPLTVIAREQSLWLRFPDYRQHELFPESDSDFFHIAFQGADFDVAYEVKFSLDEDGQAATMELVFGADSIRSERLDPNLSVVEISTPEATTTPEPTPTLKPTPTRALEPTATDQVAPTLAPTSTPRPTTTPAEPVAPTDVSVETTTKPVDLDPGTGFSWIWLIALSLIVMGGLAGWIIIRKSR